MSFQLLRSHVETPIIAAFAALTPPITTYVDNQQYTEDTPDTEFALVRLQWGRLTEPSVGCGPGELLRGVVIVELYTAKGTGPGRAQEAITPVLRAMTALSGIQPAGARVHVGQIDGPTMTPLDGRPHLMTAVSAPVKASFDA